MSVNGERAPRRSMDEVTSALLIRIEESVKSMTISVNQFTLQLSHLERTDGEFGTRLTEVEKDVKALSKRVVVRDAEVEKVRWNVVMAVVAFLGMLLNFAMEIWT